MKNHARAAKEWVVWVAVQLPSNSITLLLLLWLDSLRSLLADLLGVDAFCKNFDQKSHTR